MGEGEEVAAVNAERVRWVWHGTATGLAALSGLVLFLSLKGVDLVAVKRLFESMGVPLPVSMELMLGYWHMLALMILLATGGTMACARFSQRSVRILGTLGVLLLFGTVPLWTSVFYALGLQGMVRSLSEDDWGHQVQIEPGRASEIAREVAKGIRQGLQRGVGTFQTPDGEVRRYFVAGGPGLEDPPRAVPVFAEASRLPGCVVVPWGEAAENTDRNMEVVLRAPSAQPFSARRLDALKVDLQEWRYSTADETPTQLFARTHAIPGGDYSWALNLSRARLDTNQDGQVSRGPSPANPASAPADAYSGRLVDVRLSIFRGFDPSQNPTDRSQPVPWGNVAWKTFVFQVALP